MIIEHRITLSVPVLLTVEDGAITNARLGDMGTSEILAAVVDLDRVLVGARAAEDAAQADLDDRVARDASTGLPRG